MKRPFELVGNAPSFRRDSSLFVEYSTHWNMFRSKAAGEAATNGYPLLHQKPDLTGFQGEFNSQSNLKRYIAT